MGIRIAVSASGKNLDSPIDPRFGRCEQFLIVETETMKVYVLSNESTMASGGAGIQAAQTVANAGVKAVITGNVGPNAFRTLSAAGIQVFTGATGTAQEAIENFKNGKLTATTAPSVDSHAGMEGR